MFKKATLLVWQSV